MTNNKQQTEINAVEYLSKVNQFAKENNTDKPKQQTAVEWFNGEILIHLNFDQRLYLKDIFKQAKEMEKEETIKFTEDWYFNGFPLEGGGLDVVETIEKHYNETYGGGNK